MSWEAYLASRYYADHVAERGVDDELTQSGELCSWHCYRIAVMYREEASREE
jgi:hypothetical protein